MCPRTLNSYTRSNQTLDTHIGYLKSYGHMSIMDLERPFLKSKRIIDTHRGWGLFITVFISNFYAIIIIFIILNFEKLIVLYRCA